MSPLNYHMHILLLPNHFFSISNHFISFKVTTYNVPNCRQIPKLTYAPEIVECHMAESKMF